MPEGAQSAPQSESADAPEPAGFVSANPLPAGGYGATGEGDAAVRQAFLSDPSALQMPWVGSPFFEALLPQLADVALRAAEGVERHEGLGPRGGRS